jgi:dTDP-4-amino-4,6-dideoxygalactose transaminase
MVGIMIPLFKPYMPEELDQIDDILYSGALAYGKWGRRFEEALQSFIGNKLTMVVNSYNSAMLVTLATFDIRAGDEVIASPMSCLASNQPMAALGIKVKWVDIDPHTGTIDPIDLQGKITSNTKAIIHNHHCGYPGHIEEVLSIANSEGVYLIDDAIEAFGSEYKGHKIGSLKSDATVYSFQTVRFPNAIDGGGISFREKDKFEKARRIRDWGVDRSTFRDEYGEISAKSDVDLVGYGATPNEINSYIGFLQMKKATEIIEKQKENHELWEEKIANKHSNLVSINKDFHTPNGWVFGCLSENKMESILKFRELGYYASGVHLPNNNYSVFGSSEELKGVNDFHSRFLALPCGWWIEEII